MVQRLSDFKLCDCQALFNPERPFYFQNVIAGNLNRETSGNSKTVFLHCGDVLGTPKVGLMHFC